jgi:hypothetical protein
VEVIRFVYHMKNWYLHYPQMLTLPELLFVTCRLICAQEELQKIKTENAQVNI